jgi:hypothetical protein
MPGGEMTTALLVRHPAPFPTESLFGYILRLSEENGYTTPWSLLLLAQMGQHETRTTGMQVAKLAQVCNRPQAELQPISYRWPGDHPRSCRLLGHLLIPRELVVNKPKLCPECVAEQGFIEAHFDLVLMTGCPLHRRSLLSSCPGCMKPLRWFRPALLECQCGTSLRNVSLPALSGAEAELLDIIRRKALGLAAATEYDSGLPSSHLQAMNLRALLSLITILGNRRLVAENYPDRTDRHRLVLAAAQVLAHWPNNFFCLLRAIGEGLPMSSARGVSRGEFRGIYSSLFKQKWITPTEHADFLRLAFLDFMTNHWGGSIVDKKLMRRLRTGQSERFISQAAFARRYGMDSRTAARVLEDKGVPSTTFPWGNSERKLIDSAAVRLSRAQPGKIYRLRQAAAKIGISSALLKRLRANGDFEVNHFSRTKPGFHELDIEAFIQKLSGLAPSVNAVDLPLRKCITFAIVARGWYGSVEAKANIVRAVLSGELPVVGNVDGTVEGLLIPYEEFQRFGNDARARTNGNTRTPSEAAQHLECDPGSIPGLVGLELLRGRQTPKGLRLTEQSIAEFKKQYVSLASIAKTIGTSSRALMSFCEKRGIPIVVAQKECQKRQQAFVGAEQTQELLCFRSTRMLKSPHSRAFCTHLS